MALINQDKFSQTSPKPPTAEQLRQKKLRTRYSIIAVLLALATLTGIELYYKGSGVEVPIASNIAVLLLVNINVILLIILILLVSRNLVRLYLERKSNVAGSRFQTKLVLSYVVLTLVPSLLLFLVASGLLTNSIDKWFNDQVEDSLKKSLEVAENYYQGSEENVLFYSSILSELLSDRKMLDRGNRQYLKNVIRKKRSEYNVDAIVVFGENGEAITESISPEIRSYLDEQDMAQMIKEAVLGNKNSRILSLKEQNLVIAASPVQEYWTGAILGGTFVSKRISRKMVSRIDNISKAFTEYKQFKALKFPIKASYEITFLLITLVILFAAIWFGFYMARGISVPIQELVGATHIIAGGNLDYQIEVQAKDEIGMLVESFNRMIEDLKGSRQENEARSEELHRKNIELDRHSKYMETILENIAAGVVSIDRQGRVSTINHSAAKILGLDPARVKDSSYRKVLDAVYLDPVRKILKDMRTIGRENLERQVQLTVEGRALILLVNVTVLRKGSGEYMGMVVVFDNLTELIKAQKMAAWQEVAQGIAHEIKNPLTPIQLNTQRLRKKFKDQAPDFNAVFDEATIVITNEVEGLKRLVDEFSKFARMPQPCPEPENFHQIIDEVVALYRDNHKKVVIETLFAHSIPTLNVDREQMKRVFINLVTNAIDAIDSDQGKIEISTQLDIYNKTLTIEVADNGHGVPSQTEVRQKLFLPYFSTKKTGSGLGLAIVSRIIADHDGTIRLENNQPKGSRFIIELPT